MSASAPMTFSRLDMAKALLERAKCHRDRLNDHGTPYEDALLSGVIEPELTVVVKEIFDHLRSALDYTAREVVDQLGAKESARVYFPIVSKTAAGKDFKSVFCRQMPGVADSDPLLVEVFAAFQPFFSDENEWIADFATLCNQAKHENLNVSQTKTSRVVFRQREDGMMGTRREKLDGSTRMSNDFYVFRELPEGGIGETTSPYVSLVEIDEELMWFLRQCLDGVGMIISTIEQRLQDSAQ